jgi:hypothetical protein
MVIAFYKTHVSSFCSAFLLFTTTYFPTAE